MTNALLTIGLLEVFPSAFPFRIFQPILGQQQVPTCREKIEAAAATLSFDAFPLASCDGKVEPTWLHQTAPLQVRIHLHNPALIY